MSSMLASKARQHRARNPKSTLLNLSVDPLLDLHIARELIAALSVELRRLWMKQ